MRTKPTVRVMAVRSSAIDLRKLHKTKHWKLILRLLRVHNEINLAATLNFRISQSQPTDPVGKALEHGIQWYLLRLRISATYLAVHEVLRVFSRLENNNSDERWAPVANNQELRELWRKLKPYLPGGTSNRQRQRAGLVRNKLFAHFDEDILIDSFERMLTLSDDPLIGWHIQSRNAGPISRNLLVEQVLNEFLYRTYAIKTKDGKLVEPKQISRLSRDLTKFISTVSNFINSYVIEYLEKNKVVIKNPPIDWLDSMA